MSLRKKKIKGNKQFIKNLKLLKDSFKQKIDCFTGSRQDFAIIQYHLISRHILIYQNTHTPSDVRAKIRGLYHPLFMKMVNKSFTNSKDLH